MSALIVRLGPVANAVEQHQRIGSTESRQQVVNRVLADIRAGHHPYVPDMDDLQRIEHAGRAPAQAVRS
ncbi:hypothetical protein [Luteimonas notoginsengisoli]|uniref:Antitoxin n=1 Tax=Luteimonas notoginsengisoli TaxID=1578200 RepID=A0ABV7URA7_9GAMM